ncbi:MAG: HipA domain-containing protein [Rhodoferax sp.]|nr:HipA domain-containing protein [Rhodoferax sp.]
MSDYDLDIFVGEVRVAVLTWHPENDSFGLVYDPLWKKTGFALSPHLSLTGDIAPIAIRRFLENLLPEGDALDTVSIYSNISKSNVFGLIRQLGKETAGALTFLPSGQTPQSLQSAMRQIPDDELQARIDHRADQPFSVWDGKVRMSLAGFQDKLLVVRTDAKTYLVDGALSSTHLLKPEPRRAILPHMVANEHFCMTWASRLSKRRYGVDHVAAVDLLRVPAPVLCVRRFDRETTTQTVGLATGQPQNRVKRIHVIDGCQAANLPVSHKYERNIGNGHDVRHIRDGASFEKMFGLRASLAVPAQSIQKLMFWAVSTLLLGNSDAHGKNISFYVDRDGLRVAELYDLVSVLQYDPDKLEHNLAMAFGDEFVLDNVKSYAVADFCLRAKIPRSTFARELQTLCLLAIQEAMAQAESPIYQNEEVLFVRNIANFITTRAQTLLKQTKEIARYKAENLT